jgi:hypothetical protein
MDFTHHLRAAPHRSGFRVVVDVYKEVEL